MTREAAAGLARAMLQGAVPVTPAMRSMIEACRRAGALDEAWRLLQRLSEAGQADQDEAARALRAIALRQPPPTCSSPRPMPSPFVREAGFLPAPILARICDLTRERLQQFQVSEVSRSDYLGVDASRRKSSVLMEDADALRRQLMPHVRRFVDAHGVPAILGFTAPLAGGHEVQATVHREGDFFQAHADSVEARGRGRAITFVFYYELLQGSFSGGDLLVYDRDPSDPMSIPAGYTRLPPDHNSIVFLPSWALHEVERVNACSPAPDAGRFTLTGWLHW